MNGLIAELNNTIMSTMVIWTKVMFRVVRNLNTYSIDSAPQQIANMTLTVMTIKVTRFRTFSTPCQSSIRKEKILSAQMLLPIKSSLISRVTIILFFC